MVSIAIFLLVISSGSILGIVVWKRHFSEMLPLSCGFIIITMFIAGVSGNLKAGVYLILVTSGGFILFSAWWAIVHQEMKDSLKRLFAADTAVFVGLILIFLFCTMGMEVMCWDEFSHWMDTVKTMTLIDDLGTNPDAHVLFPSYPPALSLFHYLLQKIYLTTGGTAFSEWRYLFSFKTFSLCMIAPVFRRLRFTNPLAILFAFGSGLVFPGVFYDRYFYAGQVDPFLGLMSGVGFAYLILYEDESDQILKRFSVCAAAMILVLTKDAGLLFAAMLLLGVFAAEFLTNNTDSVSSRCIFCLETTAATVIPKIVWNIHLRAKGISKVFSNPIVFRDLCQILMQKDETWRQTSWNQFFYKLGFQKIPVGAFDFSFFTWFLLFLLLSAVLLTMLRRWKTDRYPVARNMLIITLLQLVIYVVGLGIEYLFQFGEYEGSIHASFERYIGVTYLGVLIVFQAIALELFTDEYRSPRVETAAALSLSLIILLTPMATLKSFLSRNTVYESYEFRSDFDNYCLKASELSLEGNGWLISQYNPGAYYKLKSLLKPFIVQTNCFSFHNDPSEYDMNPEDWMNQLCNSYDYVLLFEVDDYFCDAYGYLFKEPKEIMNRSFFSVDRENRTLVFEGSAES